MPLIPSLIIAVLSVGLLLAFRKIATVSAAFETFKEDHSKDSLAFTLNVYGELSQLASRISDMGWHEGRLGQLGRDLNAISYFIQYQNGLINGIVPERDATIHEVSTYRTSPEAIGAFITWHCPEAGRLVTTAHFFSSAEYRERAVCAMLPHGLKFGQFLALGFASTDGKVAIETIEAADAPALFAVPADDAELDRSVRFMRDGRYILRDIYKDGGSREWCIEAVATPFVSAFAELTCSRSMSSKQHVLPLLDA